MEYDLEIKHKEKLVRCKYRVEENTLTVMINGVSKSTQVSGMRGYEETLARSLIIEVLKETDPV